MDGRLFHTVDRDADNVRWTISLRSADDPPKYGIVAIENAPGNIGWIVENVNDTGIIEIVNFDVYAKNQLNEEIIIGRLVITADTE